VSFISEYLRERMTPSGEHLLWVGSVGAQKPQVPPLRLLAQPTVGMTGLLQDDEDFSFPPFA
jgi:hypothetical protein